ncbi:MAG: hypothetical protein WD048_00345 [Chitinophagales bacterium]
MIKLSKLILIISISCIVITSCNKEEKDECCRDSGEYVPNMVIVYVPDSAIIVEEIKNGIVLTDNSKANKLFLEHKVWKYERAFPANNNRNKDYWIIECYDCCECDLGSQFCKNLGYSEDFSLNILLEFD